ncbi:MAG: hypothetical protein JOY64_00575 [Alphaproteobacteria bacterium]|nr:hypothetical protein [Alphaproteobacteria bacterium]MBV8406098.1 hypothetical protein [Alphaproteobacteria bacterium]
MGKDDVAGGADIVRDFADANPLNRVFGTPPTEISDYIDGKRGGDDHFLPVSLVAIRWYGSADVERQVCAGCDRPVRLEFLQRPEKPDAGRNRLAMSVDKHCHWQARRKPVPAFRTRRSQSG